MPHSKAENAEKELRQNGWLGRILVYLKSLGPGLITGASDDDPSGIGTYSQTGAQFGYAQLWMAIFTFPLMTAVQEMCARIALHTGRGLADVIREYYPKAILYIGAVTFYRQHYQHRRGPWSDGGLLSVTPEHSLLDLAGCFHRVDHRSANLREL